MVSDGSEAVLALSVEGHGFDLAIFDFMMPHMNGVQAIATLRARGCRVPFLGLTGKYLCAKCVVTINCSSVLCR